MLRATAIAGVVKPPVADRFPRTSILGAAGGYTCRAAGHCRTVVRAPHRPRPASRNGPAGELRSHLRQVLGDDGLRHRMAANRYALATREQPRALTALSGRLAGADVRHT